MFLMRVSRSSNLQRDESTREAEKSFFSREELQENKKTNLLYVIICNDSDSGRQVNRTVQWMMQFTSCSIHRRGGAMYNQSVHL